MLSKSRTAPPHGAGDPLARAERALQQAEQQRSDLLSEQQILTAALGAIEASQRLGTAEADQAHTAALHRARLDAIASILQELDRSIPPLQGEVARCAQQARRLAWHARLERLRQRHEARVARRADLTRRVEALLDAIEQEAHDQALEETERLALLRDSRGLDLTDQAFPERLEPWMAWAMKVLTGRWEAGLRKGGHG